MIAVIFEVMPADDRRSTYLDLASQLHMRLNEIDGFLSIERFESLKVPGKILSLSFWRDEAAIATWRNGPDHRAAQHAGRNGTFADYRLRIASVIRDYGMYERDEAPADSRAFHAAREQVQ
ncbi:antibiotic biosynthesis monooxygenase [Rhizobium sp. PL01]|uniref:antibiotic biosynthesis monooxygenase family protein n=1 Tax=Rhizobium sp. PL01 TaxID=3085631 RepID=UPI002980AE89|nr:antibiotic biosynthesis monooxygenase [Rhizobium sp. PL01]MDW5314316.1 antibiotic biosynthesis monooxygenase [Rhizobium sp. PL01]